MNLVTFLVIWAIVSGGLHLAAGLVTGLLTHTPLGLVTRWPAPRPALY